MAMINEKCVGLVQAKTMTYPEMTPFHPSQSLPEYPFQALATEPNEIYAAVRELFKTLELDKEHFNTSAWNPLGAIISPGNHVVMKPNFVMDRHHGGGDYRSVVTHGSVIRAVADYVAIALQGEGQITIADAPMIDNDFNRIMQLSGVDGIVEFYHAHGIEIKAYDLRVEDVEMRDGLIVQRFKLPGDPEGYVPIDLGHQSAFKDVSQTYRRYRGSDYDSHETFLHHNDKVNEYLLSKTILNADVFINMPKLKTHKKIGVTLNMKNLIGINGDKNWIPHYRIGSPKQHGDEYGTKSIVRHMESLLKDRFKEKTFAMVQSDSKVGLLIARKLRKAQRTVVENTNFTKIRAGGWYGNDTVWRSVLDLNQILLYADANGDLHDQPQRRFMSVIDGIVGGEGDGPLLATAKPCGVLVGGFNPLATDICATRLMGFDYRKFPQFTHALALQKYPLMNFKEDEIELSSNANEWNDFFTKNSKFLNFRPATGWEDQIELEDGYMKIDRS